MTVSVISRAQWGARPWATTVYTVPFSARTEFVVHYDGGTPITRTGFAVPRAIDDEHHANGWAGIGYNFVADQAGTAFEGRGWNLVGAHCPAHNVSGIGVQIAIGGDQEPSAAAKHTVRALYDEACSRAGRPLRMTWHGANYATDCPGPRLIAWVKAGMTDPTPGGTVSSKFTPADLAPVWSSTWGEESAADRLAAAAHGTAVLPALVDVADQLARVEAKLDRLLAAVAPKP